MEGDTALDRRDVTTAVYAWRATAASTPAGDPQDRPGPRALRVPKATRRMPESDAHDGPSHKNHLLDSGSSAFGFFEQSTNFLLP